jgi:hypothetical protein
MTALFDFVVRFHTPQSALIQLNPPTPQHAPAQSPADESALPFVLA